MTIRFYLGLLLFSPLLFAATLRADEPPPVPTPKGVSATAAMGPVRPNVWTIFGTRVSNPTNQPIETTVATSFNSDPNLQFSTRVWVPANALRRIWQPARCPEVEEGAKGVDTTTILLDTSVNPEHQFSRDPGLLPVGKPTQVTAILADVEDDDSIDLVSAMRKTQGLPAGMSFLGRDRLSPIAAGWLGIETLVISTDSPKFDTAQVEAIRQWLVQGGKLWVFAEQVDPAFMKLLLGEDWTVEIVDRIELADFSIDSPRTKEPHTLDPPCDMVRVTAPGMDVTHTVRGWPASLKKRVGLGQVFVSTVGPRAWTTHDKNGLLVATDTLTDLGMQFFNQTERPAPPRAALQKYVTRQIGYKTISRGPIVGVLGGFCGLLLVGGLWLGTRNRLEYLAGFAAVAAVVVSTGILFTGMSQQRSVPLTIASAQIAQVIPSQQRMVVGGYLEVYSPIPDQGPLRAREGGLVWPDRAGQEGKIVRMEWTDMDRWAWQWLQLPSGKGVSADVFDVAPFKKPFIAKGSFGPDGLTGRIDPGPFADLSDMVIVGRAGKLAPRVTGQGKAAEQLPGSTFAAAEDDTLGPEQFIGAGSAISDRQQQRVDVYNKFFASRSVAAATAGAGGGPVLMGWTNTTDLGFELPQHAEHHDSTLLVIPIEVEKAEPGTKLLIPSAFIPFSVVRGPGNMPSATIFEPQAQKWIDHLNMGATVFLRFELPPQVAPMRAESIKIQLGIHAPGRTVELLKIQGQQLIAAQTNQSPLDRLDYDLKDDAFQPNAVGAINLALRISSVEDQLSTWEITSLKMTVAGEKTAPTVAQSPAPAAAVAAR